MALHRTFGSLAIRDCSRSALDLEVVEIKNTCPYRSVATVSKKGTISHSYVLDDPGPRKKVCS
jgi:hypothetical protein